MNRFVRWLFGAALALLGLLAVALALHVPEWRTGREPLPDLVSLPNHLLPVLSRRVWIDTDAACGHGRLTDVDDCLAILALAAANNVEVVGISTVFGNASLEVTDQTTRELVLRLRDDGLQAPPVYRGAAAPLDDATQISLPPAIAALQHAMREGPLTIVALGPLTNVALAQVHQSKIRSTAVVAIMGRRPGHLFHPAEGSSRAILFGHGPVFVDFNLQKDAKAATEVLKAADPLVLIPYDAARHFEIGPDDLAKLARRGRAHAWAAQRSQQWLEFWRDQVGRQGFYPFDLMGALYLVAPDLFRCAQVKARVARESLLLTFWRSDEALLVTQQGDVAGREAIYCPEVQTEADTIMRALW